MKTMGLLDVYHYVNDDLADWRVNSWFLVASPLPLAILTFAYLYFVLKCGPRYMKDRPAYKLYKFIRCYNIFQIVSNAYIIYAIFEAGWYRDYFIYCVEIDYTDSPQSMKFATISWYLLWLKIIDYIETGIFVLRKKQRQVSFLHLYHHVSTALLSWIHVKYFFSGLTQTLPLVNCTVHVVMYTYYLLSSIKSLEKSVNSVKHLITITQMVQFVALGIHSIRAFIPGCPGVKVGAIIIFTDLAINFVLFYNFYKQNYLKKQKQKST